MAPFSTIYHLSVAHPSHHLLKVYERIGKIVIAVVLRMRQVRASPAEWIIFHDLCSLC